MFYIKALNIALLIAGASIISLCPAFFNPASMSILPQLVKKDDITKANAIGQISSSASSIIGPLFGSALIATLGGVNAFIGAGILFFLSVIFLFGIQDVSIKIQNTKSSLWEDIKGSFGLIKKYDIVYKMITKMVIINFFFSSLLFSSKKFDVKLSTFLSLYLIFMGVAFMLLAFADSSYLQNLYVFIIGVTLSAFNIILISIYQTKLPQENLGKLITPIWIEFFKKPLIYFIII